MKKLFFLLIFLGLFVLTGCLPEEPEVDILDKCTKAGVFRVGIDFNEFPFGFIDENGNPGGFDVELVKDVVKKIGGKNAQIEWIEVKSHDTIQKINTGQVDFVAASMTITPQRKLAMDFSDPYFTAGQAIVVKADSDINSVGDLNKKKVIVLLGSTAEKTPKKFAPASLLVGFKTSQECKDAFLNGLAPAYINDDALLAGFITEHPEYKILPQRLTKEPYGIGFKNTEGAKSLKLSINKALAELRAEGRLDELRKNWIPE